jgi:hypothetical protein
VRQQAIQTRHPLENGWELALLIRRGVVAWMRAWPATEESQRSIGHSDSQSDRTPAEITLPSSLCKQITSLLVGMILPRRFAGLESVN